MRFWQVLLSISLIAAGGSGLLVLAGYARGILAPPLQAELVVQDFPVPHGEGINANRVADLMADQLKQRLDDDPAIRLTLKSDVIRKIKDIVLPRLMNAGPVEAMMHDIPELSAILDISRYRRTLMGAVRSATNAQDVALTVPGALLAEVDGAKVKITKTSTGLPALELGEMAAGQSHKVILWLDESSLRSDMGRMVELGASEGQRGRVLLWGDHDWFGADVEALRWSRALIGASLAGVLLFGLAILLLPLLPRKNI
jgi:hypothetical protein